MDWWLDVDEPYKRKHTLSTCRDEPFRATHLHSPGWNEGKARYETLGTYKTKNYMSSVGAALSARTFGLCCGRRSAAPTELKGRREND